MGWCGKMCRKDGEHIENESRYAKVRPFEELYKDNPPWANNKCDEVYRQLRGEHATFGMGMKFWFAEPLFGVIPGVIRTYVGYSGGTAENPNASETLGHTQCVHVEFDPKIVSYRDLVKFFCANHDSSRNPSDRELDSLILYHNDDQKRVAVEELKQYKQSVTKYCFTRIAPARFFHVAEDENQKYILLHYPALMEALHLAIGKEFIYSHRATVVNGFLAGSGTLEEFEKIKAHLMLTPHVVLYLRKVIGTNQPKVLEFPEYKMKLRV